MLTHRLVAGLLVSLSLALAGCSGADTADAEADDEESVESSEDALAGEGYAQMIRRSGRIHLTTVHTSGVRDNADAKQNIDDMAAGRKAATSAYGDARGKRVAISLGVLRAMWQLQTRFTYSVSELAGGDHGYGSLHYRGRAIDIASINGRRVGSGAPHAAFMSMCRSLGADEVLGPGDTDHSTHVHCGWR